jgi:acyl-[acyl carrier protein]--UDP-N-acetylglucosamine O-acyltransferase
MIYRSHLSLEEALESLEKDPIFSQSEVKHMVDFIKGTKRGVTRR